MPRSRPTRWLWFAALAMVAAVACGDDDAATTATTAGPATTTPGTPETPGDGCGVDAAASDTVGITGFAYEPETLEVATGTVVEWTNDDRFAHTVTFDDDGCDSGNLDGGMTYSVRFDEPGSYPYVCNIHNYMKGTVTVT